MLFSPHRLLKMQAETLQILIFLTKTSCFLCREAAFLRQKEQGNVNRCSGYRPVWFWASFLTKNAEFADVSVKKRLPHTSYTSLYSSRQLMLAGSREHLDCSVHLLPRLWPHLCEFMNDTRGGPTAEISASTRAQPNCSVVLQLVKYECEATEHDLSDEFGVLGQDQVSTEMGFNNVSRHKGEEKKKLLGGNESPLLMQQWILSPLCGRDYGVKLYQEMNQSGSAPVVLWCFLCFCWSISIYYMMKKEENTDWRGGGVFRPDALKQSSLAQWWVPEKKKIQSLETGPGICQQ